MVEVDQSLVNMGIGFAFAAAGWFARTSWTAMTALQKEISDVRIEIAGDYVKREEYHTDVASLHGKIDRVIELLGKKVDRK